MSEARAVSLVAVTVGALLGAMLAVANTLTGLKTGLWDSAQLTSPLLCFAVVAPLCRVWGRPFTLDANNLAQTACAAVAAMPATLGCLSAVPALEALGFSVTNTALVSSGWCFGLLGLVVGAVLAPLLLDRENLPFPGGVAGAQLMRSLSGSLELARARTQPFVVAMLGAGVLTLLRDAVDAVPASIETTVTLAGVSVAFGLAASPVLVGAGALIGRRIGLSLLAAGVLGWGAAAFVVGRAGWLGPHATAGDFTAWLRWSGVALLLGASLPSVWRVVTLLVSSSTQLKQVNRWGLFALALIAAATAVVVHVEFGVGWRLAAAAPVVAMVLSTVAARATGATDVAPLGEVGQLAQLVGSLGGSALGSISVANVTSGVGAQATSTLWALRAGRVIGTPVRSQLWAQLVGVAVGAPSAVLAWRVLTHGAVVGVAPYPAPSAAQWRTVAVVLQQGASALPEGALGVATGALVLGLALALAEQAKGGARLPSPLGLGLGLLVPPSMGLALAVGSVGGAWLTRRRGEPLTLSVGSGLLAGEAVFVAAVLFARAALG